ncbi:metalloregulator ArsR/SmtB family transcription factor [Rhizobiaceae bacterium]|nr:metalloregulator ArsR/SmtB family transcription factor [Rhizobiaceae bacterium]
MLEENLIAPSELAGRAEDVARQMSLLANPSRLLILCRLAEGEASVGTLQAVVGLSQSALSQHLAKLREGDVVATRRDGQTIYYRIADTQTERVMAALYEIFCRPAAINIA